MRGAPIPGFLSTTGALETLAGEAGPQHVNLPPPSRPVRGLLGATAQNHHQASTCENAALDPLLGTSNRPSCPWFLWAGDVSAFGHLQSQAVCPSALLFSLQAPSW